MKILLALIFVVLIRSCNSVDSEPAQNFFIKTDSTSYSVSNKLSVKATFTNNLGKDVNIYNAGCGFPNFILEKFENEQWSEAGGPVCVALAVAPTKLQNGKTFDVVVGMYVENEISSGSYRMKFSIGAVDNRYEPIESKYLLSNSFQIVKQ